MGPRAAERGRGKIDWEKKELARQVHRYSSALGQTVAKYANGATQRSQSAASLFSWGGGKGMRLPPECNTSSLADCLWTFYDPWCTQNSWVGFFLIKPRTSQASELKKKRKNWSGSGPFSKENLPFLFENLRSCLQSFSYCNSNEVKLHRVFLLSSRKGEQWHKGRFHTEFKISLKLCDSGAKLFFFSSPHSL